MTADFGIVFDCDGVLLDSMGMWHALDDRLAAQVGAVFTEADRDFVTSGTLLESGRYIHERFGVGDTAQDVVDIIMHDMLEFYTNEVQPKPGVMALVQELSEHGIPMGVASSTPSPLLRTGLATAGLASYMRAIVSVDDLGTSKREPLVYDTVRAALGTARERTWGIEDSLYAIRTLESAGYRTLAVYDSEIAGDAASLAGLADCCIMSFEDFTAADLIGLMSDAPASEVSPKP